MVQFVGLSKVIKGSNLLSKLPLPLQKEVLDWAHRGRSDTAANANANSDAPRKFAGEFLAPKSQTKSCELGVAMEFASECDFFCEGNGTISFSLQKFLANGWLRQNSQAIAHAMAWCTQKEEPHRFTRWSHLCGGDMWSVPFRPKAGPLVNGGSSCNLELELFCLQLASLPYSLSGCFLDALSHCKQKAPLVLWSCWSPRTPETPQN